MHQPSTVLPRKVTSQRIYTAHADGCEGDAVAMQQFTIEGSTAGNYSTFWLQVVIHNTSPRPECQKIQVPLYGNLVTATKFRCNQSNLSTTASCRSRQVYPNSWAFRGLQRHHKVHVARGSTALSLGTKKVCASVSGAHSVVAKRFSVGQNRFPTRVPL